MSHDAREAIYIEIKNIIALLRQIRGASDKEAVMQMLSENLIESLSKHSSKYKSKTEQITKREQKDLKRRFADAILLELYRQRQLYITKNKSPPQKLMHEIEKYVEKMQIDKTQIRKSFKNLHVPKSSHIKNVSSKSRNKSTTRHI